MTTNPPLRADEKTAKLLWGLQEKPSRGPKPLLSLDRIVQTAISLADAHGLAAISMQRVASELNFTKMSLYRYVTGKSELIAAMIEVAIGSPPNLDKIDGGWREKLWWLAKAMWATWDVHPWLPEASDWHPRSRVDAPEEQRILGPNEVGWVEAAVSAFSGTGLTGAERLNAVFLISGHLRATQLTTPQGVLPWTVNRTGQVMSRLRDAYGDRFPALTSAIADPCESDPREFGLERILDGIEFLITVRAQAVV